jgi:hypothetical protein
VALLLPVYWQPYSEQNPYCQNLSHYGINVSHNGRQQFKLGHYPLLRCGFIPNPPLHLSFPKNLSKIASQPPQRPKISTTHTPSTTSLQKIVGIVVSLHRV